MSWNYRVCTKRFEGYDPDIHDVEDEYSYGIYEVYYNEAGEICATSHNPIDPYGSSLDSLKECFSLMEQALEKPIINLDTLEYADPDHEYISNL